MSNAIGFSAPAPADAPALVKTETQAAPPAETTAFLQMIERVVTDPRVDIDKMERLLQMQERVMQRNARAAFASDFAAMQADLPVIAEKGKGHNSAMYALWEDINEAIRPVLAAHGFGLSFRTGRQGDRLTVTGVLSHRDGHSEETTIELPTDTSGSKNAVQAIGSSTSYGKRYIASALLNLSSRGEDDDGRAAGVGPTISDAQATAIRDEIAATGADIARFCKFFKIGAVPDLPAARFDEAMRSLRAKKERQS